MPKEFDKLVSAIKQQLKKDNSNLSEEILDKRSSEIATAKLKKESSNIVEDNLDEQGRYVVSEDCKFYIEGVISTIEE